MENLFVYGTLKNAEVQKGVIGRVVKKEEDILRGWKKTRILVGSEVFPVINRDDKSNVYGQVIVLDSDELEKVDDYKTSSYRRMKVFLASGKDAWVYVRA
jgi:gamma-glutamylcyclotransferase (GGCT)/AIG2-like uncharacterized protein YtfP